MVSGGGKGLDNVPLGDCTKRPWFVWWMCCITQQTREASMAHTHPSTPAERIAIVTQLLAHAHEYGIVTALSRAHAIARPTLYAWRTRAQQALHDAFTPITLAPPVVPPAVEREVLTLFVAAHASSRGIQT